jgi:hypothetical protein
MERNLDRKITDYDLFADRTQRPLIGQEHGTVALQTWERGRRSEDRRIHQKTRDY